MKLNPKVNVLYQSELRRDKISVIGTGPEPAKPADLTGLQGWPVRSAKKFQKTGFLSRPGMEPAGLDWGLRKLNFILTVEFLLYCFELLLTWHGSNIKVHDT